MTVERKQRMFEELREGDEVITGDMMREVAGFLQRPPEPSPPKGSQERLMARLMANMTVRSFRTQMEAERSAWGSMGALLAVLRPQLNIMRPGFWLASLLLVTVGTLFSWARETPAGLPLLILAPFLAAAGMAYAFRGDQSMREMEKAAVFGGFESFWGRTLLVLGYDLLLLLPASVLLYANGMGHSLLFLVLSWLAPMMLVLGAGLYLILRYDSLVGMLGASGIWVGLLVIGMWENRFNLVHAEVTAGAWEYRLALLVAGALVLVHTFSRIRRQDRLPVAAGE